MAIGGLNVSIDNEIRNASEQFYSALNRMANGDGGSLADIWSQSAVVTTMHPIGGRETGWPEVKKSFEQVAQLASDGQIELRDQQILSSGDMAVETGVERGRFKLGGDPVDVDIRVTNVYRREGNAWKIVHHHTDTSPSMVEVLKRLQTAGSKSAGR